MWKNEPNQPATPRVTGTTGSAGPAASRANQNVFIGKSTLVKGRAPR